VHLPVGRLEAFEMWMRKRMEKISWLDKVTNEEVLSQESKQRQANTEQCLAIETLVDGPCAER